MACSVGTGYRERLGMDLITLRLGSRVEKEQPHLFPVRASTVLSSPQTCGLAKQMNHMGSRPIFGGNNVTKNSADTFVLRRKKLHKDTSSVQSFDSFALWNGDKRCNGRARVVVRAFSTSYSEALIEDNLRFAGLTISRRDFHIAIASAVAVVLAVGNKVFYKLALVPLKNYPFFMAQLSTLGYVVVYFSILYARYRAGIVTNEMLALPKSHFIAVGVLEALGVACGMAAAAILSGASIPILSQTFLVWQLVLSTAFLRKRYSLGQVIGCIMVIVGVVVAISSGGGSPNQSLQQAGIFWPSVMVLSFAFQAGASIIKEFVFQDTAERLKGGSVDLFVVNSFGSAFQAVSVFLLLPFLSKLRGIPFSQLPTYFQNGTACFFNAGSLNTECNGAPWIPLLFVVINMGYNISMLYLLKLSSAVVSSLCTIFAVPLAIYIFTLPLPLVGTPSILPPQFFSGTAVLLAGLVLYSLSDRSKELPNND